MEDVISHGELYRPMSDVTLLMPVHYVWRPFQTSPEVSVVEVIRDVEAQCPELATLKQDAVEVCERKQQLLVFACSTGTEL